MSYRPVSLKPAAYPHNERHNRLRRTFEHSNKENLYAVPHRRLFRAESESELPTTSTQVGEMEPVCFEKHLCAKDLFSTSSSLSDDELELSRKKKREGFGASCYSTSDLTTSDSSIGPSYIKSNGRFILIPSFRHNTGNSTNSLECSDNLQHNFKLEDNDSLNSDDDQGDDDVEELEELDKRNNKFGGFLFDLRRLDSIEESPILPSPSNIHDDQDLPPQITPLRFATSATIRFPYTNPYQQPSTPRMTTRRMALEQPRSLFQLKETRSESFGLPTQMAKHYGIKGILFMTVSLSGLRSKTQLNVFIQHGTYFLQRFPELSTYITVEIKQNKRFKKRNKATAPNLQIYKSRVVKRSHQPDFNYDVNFSLHKENFCSHDKLVISVYAASADDFLDSAFGQEPLGRMTFSLRRLREKAKDKLNPHFRPEDARIKVCDGGYFLLGDKFGSVTNMPQDKVYHRKFYDDIGSTAFPSNTQFESPTHKMMGESEWRSALHHKESKLDPRRHSIQVGSSQRIPLNGRPSSSNQHYYPGNTPFYPPANSQDMVNGSTKPEHRYGPFSALIGSPRKKASLPVRTISTDQHQQRRVEQHVSSGSSSLMSKGASSSNSSSSSSTGYKSHYRFTLPAITTTTDGSDCANLPTAHLHSDQNRHVNQHLLYADTAPTTQQLACAKTAKTRPQKNLPSAASHRFLTNQPSVSNNNDKNAPHHSAVRRVASFTYSNSDDKHNKQSGKKFTFAPISKLGLLIRGKTDVNSTSALYPTKEDIRLWKHSFDSLLRDKYGRHLFRQFVIREVSSENLDFYEDVEEFKKLKPGKKATIQRANEIYNMYFKEGAAKELNLDSHTKESTKTAFEAGCLPDTFNLAQSRIEQLMAKDSYTRFINSKAYLELLNSTTPPPTADSHTPASAQSSVSVEESVKSSTEESRPLEAKSKSESPVNDRPDPLP